MKSKSVLATALAVSAVMASAEVVVAAKPSTRTDTGTLIPGRKTSAPVDSTGYTNLRSASEDKDLMALASAHAFAECVVKKHPDEARAIVLESIHDGKRLRKALDPFCLPDKKGFDFIASMRFPGDTLHQLLSNALVRVEFGSSGPTDFSTVPIVTRTPPTPTPKAQLDELSARIRARTIAQDANSQTWFMLTTIGECVARRSPEAVRVLALTSIGSTEERAAANKLAPDLAACVPVGTTVRMRVNDLRGPTVRNYYHLARCVLSGVPNSIKIAD